MRIECEVAGLPISIEAEPKEFIEILKALGCETPKTKARPIPEGAAHRVPEGAREEKIGDVWYLFYVDAEGGASVAAAEKDRYGTFYEANFNRGKPFGTVWEGSSLPNCNDYAIIGDWVRSVWEAEK